ncbi:hypothetical protein HAX54_012786 [Datura stramonium]|uniref:Uncharacterized protein n=1 Tax=Datura stramonium TaxID=4076 RepID=A0ABS8TM51_DATST|nr:hypothetical protein [Datura stramonium]
MVSVAAGQPPVIMADQNVINQPASSSNAPIMEFANLFKPQNLNGALSVLHPEYAFNANDTNQAPKRTNQGGGKQVTGLYPRILASGKIIGNPQDLNAVGTKKNDPNGHMASRQGVQGEDRNTLTVQNKFTAQQEVEREKEEQGNNNECNLAKRENQEGIGKPQEVQGKIIQQERVVNMKTNKQGQSMVKDQQSNTAGKEIRRREEQMDSMGSSNEIQKGQKKYHTRRPGSRQ